jgi:hypothetical protein
VNLAPSSVTTAKLGAAVGLPDAKSFVLVAVVRAAQDRDGILAAVGHCLYRGNESTYAKACSLAACGNPLIPIGSHAFARWSIISFLIYNGDEHMLLTGR